jgi:hypothetical protein
VRGGRPTAAWQPADDGCSQRLHHHRVLALHPLEEIRLSPREWLKGTVWHPWATVGGPQVFILSINDFFNQVGDLLTPAPEVLLNPNDPTGGTLCQIQSWSESFFELSSPMWTTAIATTLFMSVILRWPGDAIERSFKWMCLVCIGVPALLTIIPGAQGFYGVAGAWCWIREEYSLWRIFQLFIPLVLCILFNAYVYCKVIFEIKRTVRATEAAAGGYASDPATQQMQKIVNRLLRYPLILVIVWFFAAVNRITEAASGEQLFALSLLQQLFSSAQGFLNAFAYGFSSGVQEALSKDLAIACPCLAARLQREMLPSAGPTARGFRNESRLERQMAKIDPSPSDGPDADLAVRPEASAFGVDVSILSHAGSDVELTVENPSRDERVRKASSNGSPSI